MEKDFFEKEYMRLISDLTKIAKRGAVTKGIDEDGFEYGIDYGRRSFAKDLVIQMQKVVIDVLSEGM